MAEVRWIRPRGKSQADLDAERSSSDREKAVQDAREYLRRTDYLVIKAAEQLISAQGLLDAETISARQAARDTISGK